MLIVIGEERQSHELIETTGRFGMSILHVDQAHIAKHFAIPPKSRGSLEPKHITTLSKSPVIKDSIASMDCSVIVGHKAGDHTVFIGEVEAIMVGDGAPLVWLERQFGGFLSQNLPQH
jgi:flavin reductase (DIM6/NTAB) family NADH-FMN oxidoreductase RutF